ncbi:hypothetical protein DFR28_1011204, partial [Arenicella xantha]
MQFNKLLCMSSLELGISQFLRLLFGFGILILVIFFIV